MRIKKVSETTPVQAQIVDGYSTSTTDGYSANHVNKITATITAGLTNNETLTISGNYRYTNVPLDNYVNSNSDVFEFSNNKITVKKSGYYKISASMLASLAVDTVAILVIYKNNTLITQNYQSSDVDAFATSIAITPYLLELNENDVISLSVGQARNASNTSITLGGTGFTYLTVEAVKING